MDFFPTLDLNAPESLDTTRFTSQRKEKFKTVPAWNQVRVKIAEIDKFELVTEVIIIIILP